MKSFHRLFNERKRNNMIAAALMAAAVFTFSGCSTGTAADNGASSSVAQQTAANQANLSDARNTPAVRAAKVVGPAVVGITNKAVARDWFNNPVETEGVGSGVIFKNDGGDSYIVTNNHVISGAKELIVSLPDGKSLKGKLVGADEVTDLAVVKVSSGKLPTAKFGDSDKIVVGEPAIAIGNPMGLEFQGSVTSGVISALNRTLDISDKRVKLLQTDAAINPGNSGGALVNADGEVIGINSAKVAANGVEGMGFAIPINTVQNIIDQLMDKGYVARPYLGVSVFGSHNDAALHRRTLQAREVRRKIDDEFTGGMGDYREVGIAAAGHFCFHLDVHFFLFSHNFCVLTGQIYKKTAINAYICKIQKDEIQKYIKTRLKNILEEKWKSLQSTIRRRPKTNGMLTGLNTNSSTPSPTRGNPIP